MKDLSLPATTPLSEAAKEEARRLGFLTAGIASPPALHAREEDFRRWLSNGYAGGLAYMEDFARRQARLIEGFPDLRSIVILAAPYGGRGASPLSGRTDPLLGRVARYARGRDYHRVLHKRIRRLEAFLLEKGGQGTRTQHHVDKGPVQERVLAESAGLGFIGKNTMLIHPKAGSYLFLAVILTNLDLEPDRPIRWDCGTCTLCLEACPTQALPAPYQLDAGRCIANLTIENRGPIPAGLRPSLGNWVFGCDICQEVCPYNRGRVTLCGTHYAGGAGMNPGTAPLPWPEFSAGSGAGDRVPLQVLLSLTNDEEALERFAGTPLLRAKRTGLLRNAAVAAGNSCAPEMEKPLVKLLRSDPDPMVRAHCAWALGRIGSGSARQSLSEALPGETDPSAAEEIRTALQDSATAPQTSP